MKCNTMLKCKHAEGCHECDIMDYDEHPYWSDEQINKMDFELQLFMFVGICDGRIKESAFKFWADKLYKDATRL